LSNVTKKKIAPLQFLGSNQNVFLYYWKFSDILAEDVNQNNVLGFKKVLTDNFFEYSE
jgi:hypothetical protein